MCDACTAHYLYNVISAHPAASLETGFTCTESETHQRHVLVSQSQHNGLLNAKVSCNIKLAVVLVLFPRKLVL